MARKVQSIRDVSTAKLRANLNQARADLESIKEDFFRRVQLSRIANMEAELVRREETPPSDLRESIKYDF